MKLYYVSSEIPLYEMDDETAKRYISMLDEVQERIFKYAGWYLKFGSQEFVYHRLYHDAINEKWEILDDLARKGYFNSGFHAHDWYRENSNIEGYRKRGSEDV